MDAAFRRGGEAQRGAPRGATPSRGLKTKNPPRAGLSHFVLRTFLQRSCSVAILFAAIMVYQGSPFGATVIPNGPLPLTALPSVTTPALVILAALPEVSCVNQTLPSGEAAMPEGPVSATGNSVTELLAGLSRPTAWGVNRAVNQTCPSEATVMSRGTTVREPLVVGVRVMAPVVALMRTMLLLPGRLTSPDSVNHALPAGSTATSAGVFCAGTDVSAPFEMW